MIDQPRSSHRYEAKVADDEGQLVNRMLEFVRRHPRYGYRRIGALLRRDGWSINNKRMYRLWRREGLRVRWYRFQGQVSLLFWAVVELLELSRCEIVESRVSSFEDVVSDVVGHLTDCCLST